MWVIIWECVSIEANMLEYFFVEENMQNIWNWDGIKKFQNMFFGSPLSGWLDFVSEEFLGDLALRSCPLALRNIKERKEKVPAFVVAQVARKTVPCGTA
jgi:hypothetical protein